jgi:hypothetical protein
MGQSFLDIAAPRQRVIGEDKQATEKENSHAHVSL